MKNVFYFLTIGVVMFASEADSKNLYIMIDSTYPANTTYLSLPADTPEKKITAMKEYVAKNSKTSQLVKMSELKKDKDKYIASKIKKIITLRQMS